MKTMRHALPLLAALLGAPLVTSASLIDFNATAYPSVPTSLAVGDTLLDTDGNTTNFSYIGQVNNTGTVTTGHYLSMTSDTVNSSTSWVRDNAGIAFSGPGAQDIYRSVKLNVSTVGSGSGLTVGLLTPSAVGTANGINSSSGFILSISAITARNQFRILRQTETGAEFWTGSAWSTDANNYIGSFSGGTNYQVVMEFDVDSGNFSLSIIDESANFVQATATTNISDLSGAATTDGSLIMAVGDMFNNSGNGWTTNITEISTVPEPAQMGMGLGILVLLASLIVRSRRQ